MTNTQSQPDYITERPDKLNQLRKFNELPYFTGTEHYYRYMGSRYTYTDGVKFVADNAEAYWLLDVVFTHCMAIARNKNIPEDQKRLYVCNLLVNDAMNTALFTVSDGNYNDLARQEIEYTDFPAKTVTIWVQNMVAMLPSEY